MGKIGKFFKKHGNRLLTLGLGAVFINSIFDVGRGTGAMEAYDDCTKILNDSWKDCSCSVTKEEEKDSEESEE